MDGTILVTGATGTVGRHVVTQLCDAGHRVRALSRDPRRARLPVGVEVVAGDLTDPASVEPALVGVTAVHLMTCSGADGADLATGPELVGAMTRAGVARVSVLGGWGETSVEAALRAADLPWTRLEPVEFMSGALEWAGQLHDGDTLRLGGNHPSALVHEADIAAVSVVALTRDGHAGRAYRITGPQALTPAQQVAAVGAATGRELAFVRLTPDEERARLRDLGHGADVIEFGVALATSPPADAGAVSPTVTEVTGRPARSFGLWAAEHAAAFRRSDRAVATPV